MKLFILFLSVGIFSLPLFAQRVIVTKTADRNNLRAINAKLATLQVKMYVKKSDNYYFIYTKEYQTEARAEVALQKIKRFFPYARVLKERKLNKIEKKSEKNWIAEVRLGNSSIDSYSGMEYSLKAGYFLNKNFLSTLSYSSTSAGQTEISNFYFAEDYYYNVIKNSNIYIGALLGYSSLTLDLKNSTPSTSVMYGIELGTSYDITDALALSFTYQTIMLDHSISFPKSTLTVDSQNVIELGIAYKF